MAINKKKASHARENTLEERVADLEQRVADLESEKSKPVTQEEFDQFKKSLHEAGIRLLEGYSGEQ